MPANCPNCGSAVVEQEQICANCGSSLGSAPCAEPITLFYSYSHKDEKLREELEAHLAALRRSGVIREWHDRKIIAGQDWDKEISKYLESARLILFLISADFISSSYISHIEVKRALERQSAGDAAIIPVILRPVIWRIVPEFSRLQALPDGARPVTEWPSHDLAFVSICEGILAVVLSRASASALRRHAAERKEEASHGRSGVFRGRRRILDAALPARVPLSRPSVLLAMVRRTDSPGLRGIVEADPNFDISPQDIVRRPLTLMFPVDENGAQQPLDLTIKIESPQFEPKSQIKTIKLRPRGDSDARVFLLAPTETGPLVVNVEIYHRLEILGGCVLRTLGVLAVGAEAEDTSQSIVSSSLPLSGDEDESEEGPSKNGGKNPAGGNGGNDPPPGNGENNPLTCAAVDEMEPGAVYLSYATEDRSVVEKLKTALEEAGVDVFLTLELEPRDYSEGKLHRNIGNCSFFVPVISRNTLTRERRFFRVEWRQALERAASSLEHFLLPIVIDDTAIDDQALPAEFKRVQTMRLPHGEPTPEFVDWMKQLYRRSRLERSTGV